MEELIASVIAYGVAGHSIELALETLAEIDSDLVDEVRSLSNKLYSRFDEASKAVEELGNKVELY